MADGRTGLSQALEQAFLTFAGAIAQNQVQNVPHIGSSVQQSASATVASSASVHVMPPVVSPAPTPRSETQTSSTREYSAVHILPSFLKRKGTRENAKSKKPKVIKQWDRDVVCLPPRTGGGNFAFPRGSYRSYLAKCGLIGKLHMTSKMSEEEVATEICSIFKAPMKNNAYFQFQYLHPTGGGTKCLAIPAQSSSFKWTAQQVACLAGQAGTIYILAQEDLDLSEDDSSNDELGGDIHDAPIPVMSSRRQSLPLNNDESSDDDDQFPVGPVQLSGRKSTTEVEMVDESMVPGPSNTNLPAQSGVSQDIIQKTDEKNTDGLYNNYVNLLSSDEELIFSPISPVYSLLTPPETTFIDYHSVEVLLKKHGSEVLSDDKDDVFRLKVRRRHIMEDSLQYFKRGIPVSKHLRVTFLGEPAVDAGGPLREFFRLLLREISNNNMLFCGEETARVPIHNILELSKQTFRYVGQIIGSSLLNGGPSPGFFADFIADYIVFGIEKVQVRVQDVVDPKMKSKLTELLNAPDEDSFITLLDSDDYDFRYDCGVRQPTTMMTINDRDDIVSALAMQTVFSIKAEMDQMIAGLNDYGLGELARNNSEVLRQLFVHYRQLPLTSDTLYDMFAPQLSSSGSNIRNEEEAALMHWVYYTRDVQDGKQILEVTDSQTLMKNTFQVSLKLIMIFATGMAEEPPMGFDPKPSLRFHNDIPYARANTCSNEISIPRQFKDYEDFAYNVTYGIANSMGFGVP